MTRKANAAKRTGFLARLIADQSGNIVAMTAAAVLPVVATVGGAIDISRVYAVKARMQAACDAGALSGRRVMGSAAWGTTAENAANTMFSANFESDFFGSTTLLKDFDGVDGVVTGTVSANVPMTLMRVFGTDEKPVAITCTSEMKIPHTDVMFVLDTTGSMNCAPADNPCTGNGGVEKVDSRMAGLRKSVNCFYEALGKLDTGEVCDPSGTDPAATGLAAGIQLRIGFMPYSSNINVGNLVPTAYFADNWTYQSRSPIVSVIDVWNDTGGESFGGYSAESPSTRPGSGNHNVFANYNGFSNVTPTGAGTHSIPQKNGSAIVLNKTVASATSTNCIDNNTIDSKKLRAVGDTGSSTGADVPGTSSSPNYTGSSTGTRTRPNTRTITNTVTGYRYAWDSGASACRLQSATGKTSSNDSRWYQTQTRTGTFPIAWTTARELTGWTLQPRAFDISGLKNGTNWNNSVTVPDLTFTTASVRRSGTNSATTINTPANLSVSWGGCIEERQTYMNVDTNPDDEWAPIPSTAFDMDFDTAPTSDIDTQWAPALQGLIYSRLDSGGNRTMASSPYPTTGATNTNRKLNTLACPTEATKLSVYTDGTDIADYTDSLRPAGATYHDIGLLWGARFLSPTGIFGTENSTDASGNLITIQRHMIFMTDGDTGSCSTSYSPYGIAWWDRRQTNKTDPNDDGGTTCTNSYTNRIVDARTAALCAAIKNKNITLWVVSFGAGVNAASETRLQTCASSSTHFYDADSTDDLLTAFQEIALQISRLRLQS